MSLRWNGLGLVGISVGLVLAGGVPAQAEVYVGPAQTAQLLRSSQVVIADDSEVARSVDLALLQRDVGSARHVYVAVLPARGMDRSAKQTAADIGQALGDDSAVVVVAVGRQIGAAQGPRAPLPAGEASRIAVDAQQTTGDVQSELDSAIGQIRRVGSGGAVGADINTNSNASTSTSGGGGGPGMGAVGGLLVVLCAVGGAFLWLRRRKAQRAVQERTVGLRAEVDSLYGRLSNDVSTLNAGDDVAARQALVDASERYTATGALLADPRASAPVLAQAKRTAIEGIMACRVARQRLGLDLGMDPMPPAPPSAPQVQGSQVVQVDGQSYTGHGQYQPGASNYFGGGTYQGRYIPGGWYARPFWQTAAISAVAFGGLGYALGGGFGDGDYERGDGFGDGGGDWSGGGGGGNDGGGDWSGGGGGDWGDSGGGGGGGGDWG